MALHNRDYMGGAAPPPGSSAGFSSPWRVYRILIALNVLVFLFGKTAAGEAFLLEHALVSLDALRAGRVWTLLLGGFFHLDFVHLGLATGFVYLLGWRIEQEQGPGVLLTLYLLGSLATGGASLVVNGSPGLPSKSEGLPVSTGSGFFVAKGLALTNAHVVKGAETLEVQLEGEPKPVPARVRASDETLDLALIEIDVVREPLLLAPQRPPVGLAVFAYGYGSLQGDTKTQLMTSGRVSGFRNEKQWLVFDGKVNPGNSGGPLVDAAGRWVGVVVAKTRPGPGEDSLGFAIEGGAVQAWLALHGVHPETSAQKPSDETPPAPELGRSVGRLVVRGQPGGPLGGKFLTSALRLDPWLFGASGGFFALAGFLCFAEPRRQMFVLGNPVPLIVVVGFGGVADLAGALRAYTNFHSWAHLYHFSGALVGVVVLKLYQGKIRAWLAARQQQNLRASLVVLEGGGRSEEPRTDESKLSLADRARLDRVLEKVSKAGLDSLSEEERAFLDETSGKLRGE